MNDPEELTLAGLGAMERPEFMRRLGGVLENSPQFAGRVWHQRPFASRAALLNALVDEVRHAPQSEQLALLRAHPDLANRLVSLTEASAREQAEAGLGGAADKEVAEFQQLNARYHERFGFPFIICARLNSRDAILNEFRRRVEGSPAVEFATALGEVEKIARLRLADLVSED